MHFTGTKSSPYILLLLKYKKCSDYLHQHKFQDQLSLNAFCNTFDLHLATICHKDLCFVYF